MKTGNYRLLDYIAVAILLASHITFSLTFIIAYSVPSKATLVLIDNYHEANIELALLIISWIVVIIWLYWRGYKNVYKVSW